MNKLKQTGVTLLEILLVLVISAAIIFIGLRQYQAFKLDSDLQTLRFNIDTIFRGLAAYYSANCYGTTSPSSGVLSPGSLNPVSSPALPLPVDVNTQLFPRFIQAFPLNPLVDQTGPGSGSFKGYVAQFNRQPDQTRLVCMNPPACSSYNSIGTIANWTMQVAVLIADTDNLQQYKNLLAADCVSTKSGATVQPCSVGASGNYLVFERLPSYPASNANNESPYWSTNPTLQQFRQMYTTYPINYLLQDNPSGRIPGPGASGKQSQYFLCGS